MTAMNLGLSRLSVVAEMMEHLTITPIVWDRVTYLNRWAAQDGSGAVVTFVGVVRADRDGHRVIRALFYEAYPEMAEHLLQRLISQARARWSLDAVQVQHRLGLVEVSQMSVVIVIAAQHRNQAFAASQFLLEGIKEKVPIWKRHVYDDGTTDWGVGSHEILQVADPQGAEHADV